MILFDGCVVVIDWLQNHICWDSSRWLLQNGTLQDILL